MQKFKLSRRLTVLLYVAAILLLCHHFIFRPIFLDWGSPEPIQALSLSGDDITGGTRHTRAVLIEATPEELWPWVVQLGQDRGGFYSHEWLENLFLAEMKNVYEVRPEFQRPRSAGDTVWLASQENYGGQGYQVVAESVPFQSLVMVSGDDYARILNGQKAHGSWAIYLYPESHEKTWLIARSAGRDVSFGTRLLRYFTFEVPHFIMEKKMLTTVKNLAEK